MKPTPDAGDSEAIIDNVVETSTTGQQTAKRAVEFLVESGEGFILPTAELLVAQNLGARFRFAFVNTLTRAHIELTLPEIFARARGIYPTWSIQF